MKSLFVLCRSGLRWPEAFARCQPSPAGWCKITHSTEHTGTNGRWIFCQWLLCSVAPAAPRFTPALVTWWLSWCKGVRRLAEIALPPQVGCCYRRLSPLQSRLGSGKKNERWHHANINKRAPLKLWKGKSRKCDETFGWRANRGAACECGMAERVEVKASLPPAALVALPVAVAAQHVCRKLAKENKNRVSESGGSVEFLLFSLRVQRGLTLRRCFFPNERS